MGRRDISTRKVPKLPVTVNVPDSVTTVTSSPLPIRTTITWDNSSVGDVTGSTQNGSAVAIGQKGVGVGGGAVPVACKSVVAVGEPVGEMVSVCVLVSNALLVRVGRTPVVGAENVGIRTGG